MKLFLNFLRSTILSGIIGLLLLTNFYQKNNIFNTKHHNSQLNINSQQQTKRITLSLLSHKKNNVTAVYKPNNPRASFHYIDITKNISKKNFSKNSITLWNIDFEHQQTETHKEHFNFLKIDNNIFESSISGNPENWDDQTFYQCTSIIKKDIIEEGVTRYYGQLSVGLTKDTKTGKIFFVWGVYGHVILGSNQASVKSQAKAVIIDY